MRKNSKYSLFFFGLLAIAVIVAMTHAKLKQARNLSPRGDIEVEIMEDETFPEVLQEESVEDSIEQDVEELEITEENGVSGEPGTMETEAETDDFLMLPAPIAAERNSGDLKVGFITDLHVRSNSIENGGRIIKPFFRESINRFVEKMNNEFVPDFIVVNGDVIEGTGRSSDIGMRELTLIQRYFERTSIPKHWVIGNHDLRSVDKKQWQEALNINYLRKSFEAGEYKIFILDSNFDDRDKDIVPDVYYARGRISERQIAWLEKELGKTDKKSIVFIHHPPLWNTDGKKNGNFPSNALKLQEIFSRNNVLAVFAGHIEDLYFQEIDGVNYFVSPGLVKNKKYQGTFSEITIKENEMSIDLSYLKEDGNYRTIRIKKKQGGASGYSERNAGLLFCNDGRRIL